MELLQGLLGGLDGEAGEEQPLDGLLALGRVHLAGQHGAHLDVRQGAVRAMRGLESEACDAQLLVDAPRRTPSGGGQVEFGLGQHRRACEPGALGADEPLGAGLRGGAFREHLVDVGLAVGDIDQLGLGQGLDELRDASITLQPAQALFFLDGPAALLLAQTARLAGPAP